MIHLINETCRGPMLRIVLPTILIAIALFGSISEPAAAAQPGTSEEFHLAVTDQELQDDPSLTRIRRRIAIAARALCDPRSVETLYSTAARLCREQVRADAERQIEDQIAALRGLTVQGRDPFKVRRPRWSGSPLRARGASSPRVVPLLTVRASPPCRWPWRPSSA